MIALLSTGIGNGKSVTFGLPLRPRAAPAGRSLVIVTGSGAKIPTQTNHMAQHDDGSLRHAFITADVPQGDAIAAVDIGPNLTGSLPFSPQDIVVHLKTADRVLMASAKDATYEKWLDGPLMREDEGRVAFTDKVGNADPHLKAIFHVRRFASGEPRIGVVVENTGVLIPNPELKQYDVTISIDGNVVWQKTGVNHFWRRRWIKRFGPAQSLCVWPGLDYLTQGRWVPNYNRDRALTAKQITAAIAEYTSSPHDILERGVARPGMRAPGGSASGDIGQLPDWQVNFLLSGDPQLWSIACAQADLAGGWNAHQRYEVTGEALAPGDLPNYSDSSNYLGNPGCAPREDKKGLKPPLDDDFSHEPSFAFLPYMLGDGDKYHLDELVFYALDDLYGTAPGSRGHERGLWKWMSTRGQGWQERTSAHASYIMPDAHPLKGQISDNLFENLSWYANERTDNPIGLHQDGANGIGAEGTTAPWMQAFMTSSHALCVGLGFEEARPVLEWSVQFIISRLLNPDYDWRLAGVYHMQVADPGSRIAWSDWAKISAGTGLLEGDAYANLPPNDLFVTGQNPDYIGPPQAALAMAASLGAPRAREAFDKLVAALADLRTRRTTVQPVRHWWDIVPVETAEAIVMPEAGSAFLPAGTTSWVVPATFNPASNRIKMIGPGGAGHAGAAGGTTDSAGGGGGGGAFAESVNVPLIPESTLETQIPLGGAELPAFIKNEVGEIICQADCGLNALPGIPAQEAGDTIWSLGGRGGLAVNSVGDTRYDGGKGGDGKNGPAGAGGGAAGPNGVGKNGGSNTNGGGNKYHGAGGGGSNGGLSTAGGPSGSSNTPRGVGGKNTTGVAGGARSESGSVPGSNGQPGCGGGGGFNNGGTAPQLCSAGGDGGSHDGTLDGTHGSGGGGAGGGGHQIPAARGGAGGSGGDLGGGGGGGGGAGYTDPNDPGTPVGGARGEGGAAGIFIEWDD